MVLLGQEVEELFRILGDGLVGDHVGEVVDAVQLVRRLVQLLADLLLERLSAFTESRTLLP